jgi:hypothetical protein
MTLSELQAQVALSEDSRCQFKQDMQSPDALEAARCSAVLGQVCLGEKAQAHPLLPCYDLCRAVKP